MVPCDDLLAKPELLHWGRMIRARREPVAQLCRANVNSDIKEHGITCRVTAATFGGNASCVRALRWRFGFPYVDADDNLDPEDVSFAISKENRNWDSNVLCASSGPIPPVLA
ncbi:hypothetical protein AVEN_56985-1, partial [Araneus ventricosus]